MEWLRKLVQYYLNNHEELAKWRKRVSVMAAVVVFITTYALILPAITVDKDASTPEQGMYLESGTEEFVEEEAGEENRIENQADVPADIKAGEEAEEKAVPGDNSRKDSRKEEQSTEQVREESREVFKDDSKTKAGSETENTDDKAESETENTDDNAEDEIQDEKEMDAGQDSTERKLEASNDFYTISLSYNKQARIPEGAVLRVREAQKGSKIYGEYLEKAKMALLKGKEGKEISGIEIRFFDISIRDKGRQIQPEDAFDLEVLTAPVKVEDPEKIQAIHFWSKEQADKDPEILETETEETEKGVESVRFTAEEASMYAVVYSVEYEDKKVEDKTEAAAGYLEAGGEDYTVSLTYGKDAGIPADAELEVRELTKGSEEYDKYLNKAKKGLGEDQEIKKQDDLDARFFDIRIMDDGQEIQPKEKVNVEINANPVKVEDPEQVQAVQFNEDEAEFLEAETEETKKGVESVQFETEEFSVCGIIYTVDFHFTVDGKTFSYSIPGGGYITMQQLVEVLGIANDDEDDKSDENEPAAEDGESKETAADTKLTLSDVEISDRTKAFVAEVENVEFSSPELVWVDKVDEDSTVGGLKKANELECQYSGNLTKEQIEEINKSAVIAGDWALIGLQPFTSNEKLTITMKNGDQFVVKVTDAPDPSIFLGKEVIIYDNTEKQAMTSDYATDYRTHFNTVDEVTADGNSAARWKIVQANGGYYLQSNDGKYLYLDHTNVRLVDNQWEATLLTIQAGGNPDYRIYAANNNQNALRYCENNQYPGFFSAVDGTNGAGNSREWLYIREATTVIDRAGDWLLYFDDDFSDQEITIRVGETITLRPYNKWEWKEGSVDVQTAHWNVGTWNDWSISSSDGNGSKLSKSTDGPFEFTRYVKYDDQLITHYWSVQGIATQTGTYTLTNTKNNKTITVHVVDEPVDHPKTINKIANIKVNLFDYDKNGLHDGSWNNNTQWWNDDNLANQANNYKDDSVNKMGGSDHFYFLSSGSGDNSDESWNSYTHDDPNLNIVKNALDENGYPVLNHGSNTSLKYLFDKSKTTWNGGNNNDGMICYPDVIGMFQKDNEGYYYFNSNTNYYYYDTETGTSQLYEHTYTQTSSKDKNSLVNDKPIGFFPFHEYDSTNNLSVNQNHNLNHHIGMSMELEFMLPRDRTDDNNQPIIFDFSGDDDLWVFVEWVDDQGKKQSKLLLDLGGVHQPIHGDINFTNGANTAFMETNRPYTLKVFYLERGGCDSNCSIRFNLPIIQDLAVAKKLTGLTEAEKEKYKNEEFWYEIVIDRKPYGHPVPYNYPNQENRFEKAIIRNAAGVDVTPDDFTITNGRFKLKDGETLSISYLDRTDKFTVAELKTANMENFERPNAERYYHQEHDASLYEEEIALTASHTVAEPAYDDWVTPEYELEDTEKITFTNTFKEKNLEVEKKWIGNKAHPNSITFTVSATVDDGTGGRTPYPVQELINSNGSAKQFTLNDGNDWRHEIEHLPVNTPDGKFIFYDIQEGHAEGYTLTGIKDLTAEKYNYCNVDVVKLWPDSNGEHTEIVRVVLQNPEGKYYAGVDDNGEAIFSADQELASVYELKPENNYTHRFDRVPALPEGQKYTAVQLNVDQYSEGLALYTRDIIQYDLENTPLVNPTDPEPETVTPDIHKRIDALRDGITNPDSPHPDEDLTDLYRLYLDYKVKSTQDPNGVDLLFVIDQSGSMNDSHWPGNEYRGKTVMKALNGDNGLISKFLAYNDKNQWAAVGFTGPDGFQDYTFDLKNPWDPCTDKSRYNAGENGSEVLSPEGTSYVFTRNSGSLVLNNEKPLLQSNYTAGFWRAEQFLLKENVKNDGRKKVVVFIADGVPTLHINNLNGSLQSAGQADGSPYYREEYGGCPDKALTEFGYFLNDMTANGYSFSGDNSNIEFYTIGLGPMMQTEGSSDPDDPMSGSELLNGMLAAAYGQNVPANHFMTIADTSTEEDSSVTNTLKNDLRIILGMNDTFSNLVIQDDLSKYVDLYGLTSGAGSSAVMDAAKAKVTMTVPDANAPSGSRTVTLYKEGAPVDSDDAKFTKADNTKATIVQELVYDTSTKTVKAIFNPEYQPASNATYTLSFDVKATDEAYTTYAANGYDKYTSGDYQGQVIVGDEDTDFLGTDPPNATSVDKPGFRSNDEAKATYKHNSEDEEKKYPHPVIQVSAKVDIVKIDQNGDALEGAKFNLYDDKYDASKTIAENAGHLIEADLQSKKPANPAGDDAVIRDGKLAPGTYYLVETETPAGFNTLEGPVKIMITETDGSFSIAAEIAGTSIPSGMIEPTGNGVWKLKVQNSAGYELPHTGGIGTNIFTLLGIILTALSGSGLILMKRRRGGGPMIW